MTNLHDPIFILGSHKSGSSLLRSLFDGHPDLFVIPTETHFFQYTGYWIDYRLRTSFPKKRDLNNKILSLTNLVTKKNQHQDQYADSIIKGEINIDKFKEVIQSKPLKSDAELFESYINALHYSILQSHLDSKKRIVEKSVEHAEYASLIKKMYPTAKFVHIIRNPYASLVAIRKSKTCKGYPFLGDFLFSIQNSYYNLFKNTQIIDDYLIVRYEDLLTSTENTMQKISDFLGLDFTKELLKPTMMGKTWSGNSTSTSSFNSISTAPLSNWKNAITHVELHLINNYLSEAIDCLGYKIINPQTNFYYPIKTEGVKTYFKNRLLLSARPVEKNAP